MDSCRGRPGLLGYQFSSKYLKAFGVESFRKSSTEGSRPRAVGAMAGRVCRPRGLLLVDSSEDPGDGLDCREGKGPLTPPKL